MCDSKATGRSAIVLLACLLAPGASVVRAQFEWAPPIPYPSALSADGFATGDLDGDGHADLVRCDRNGDRVTTLLGDGTGSFRDGVTVPLAGLGPVAVAAADVDGDGFDDVIVANYEDVTMTVLRSDGLGGFSAVDFHAVEKAPSDVDVADVDRDGRPDVLVACAWGGDARRGIALWHGDGAGGFERYEKLFSDTLSRAAAAALLDGDEWVDLVIGAGSLTRVSLGDGAGGFLPAVDLEGRHLNGVWDVEIGDIDGDGDLDLAVAGAVISGNSVILVHHGDGAGGFVRVGDPIQALPGTRLAIGDLDRDGRADLVVGAGSSVRTYLADGAGAFALVAESPIGAVGLVAADFDEDGYEDAAVSEALFLNRVHETRRGTVNALAGADAIADVLFVNGSPGTGRERRVDIAPGTPLSIAMAAAPSCPGGPCPFAWFVWKAEPGALTPPTKNRFGIGRFSLPTPLHAGSPRPFFFLNNLKSLEPRLGPPSRPSAPAPSLIGERASGLSRRASFFLQGLMRDASGPDGRAAVTNAIQLRVR